MSRSGRPHPPGVQQPRAANRRDEDLLGSVRPLGRLDESHGGRVQARLSGEETQKKGLVKNIITCRYI